jgi:DNA-binding response OmpR family regulator
MESSPPIQFGRLIATHPNVEGHEYILDQDVYTIGRSATCQIIVPLNVVSRLHAKIERLGPRYMLSDVGSANGTFVNSRQIQAQHLLQDRDVIGLGSPLPILRFMDPDPTSVPLSRLRYDDPTMTFFLEGQPVNLSPAQFRLLHLLYQHAGTVCTRESCAQALWRRDYDPNLDSEALDRAISTLRSELRRIDAKADLIETRRGLGYLLKP